MYAAPLLFLAALQTQAPVDFDREIRPLLAERCIACHGPDEAAREGKLRLDQREDVFADRGGYALVVPGVVDESELYLRISAGDDRMPPASAGAELNPEEIELLRRWIHEGASWSEHWSLVPPRRPVTEAGEAHPIDQLVRQRIAEQGLELSPRAAVHTLARRLALDLTGLPATLAEVARLRADDSPENWSRWIDELLVSGQHAERLAMWWLDGARYSDTDGFQQDAVRTSWPWRDWVVDAFEANMAFDRFTIEQVAGDLLPQATDLQRLATSFHRNHMGNGEGGRIAEESRIDYVRDRVNTTGTLWLGMTFACAQCHDHKFDPFSQRDYYRLAAYFDSIDESGAAGGHVKPTIQVQSPYAERALAEAQELSQRASAAQAKLRASLLPQAEARIVSLRAAQGPVGWTEIVPLRLASVEGSELYLDQDGALRLAPEPPAQDDYLVTAAPTGLASITGLRLEVFPHADHVDAAWSFAPDGEFLLTGMKMRARHPGASSYREVSLVSAVADVEGVAEDDNYKAVAGALDDDPRTGWTIRGKARGVPHVAVFALSEPLVLEEGETLEVVLMQRSLFPHSLIGRFRLSVTNERGSAVRSVALTPREELARLESDELPASLRKRLVEQYLEEVPEWRMARRVSKRIHAQERAAKRAAGELTVMVLAERSEPRITHLLRRGVWDDPGAVVTRGVPAAILPRPDAEVATRLELAKWLVDAENPLTARAIVNQLWQLLFGAGLVPSADDLGLRGARPVHPLVLDWLAVEFVESGWDIRHLLRTIVSSATYQQRSTVSPELRAMDPDNRWLARGARYRMPSWMIRDATLAASGLLNPARGGPPVFPYQPPGVWADQFMGRLHYEPTLGPEQHRRTLYAFWRRNSSPAFLFDMSTRRECDVGIRRTNSPLHALTLLNDRTFLDASRALALRVLPGTSQDVVEQIFEAILLRRPDEQESAALLRVYELSLSHYEVHAGDAQKLMQASTPRLIQVAGQLLRSQSEAQLASACVVASLVFNLDEALTRE